MVGSFLKYPLLGLLLFISQGLMAQGHLFSEVSLDRSSVYVGQPVEVTVSVFTSTWFTKGVDPGNIKVNGAFTVYFRSVSTSERIDGKTFAGVRMLYHVFPFEEENLTFPSLEIRVETPDEGSSQGVSRTVTTREREIEVKPVPANMDRDQWMVATNVSVSERWNGELKQVKVGDVLERTIVREVPGSVAELIPPIRWDSISGVSSYPSRAEVNNSKTRTSFSASRTDGINYLFEEEGEVEIPELVISWWNPQAGRMQKRTLKAISLTVLPNPDLGMLTSIRDSLAVAHAAEATTEEAGSPVRILGLSILDFIVAVLLLLLLMYVIYRVYRLLKGLLAKRLQRYRNSEAFYFKHYREAARRKDRSLAVQALYRWIDQLSLEEPSLAYFVKMYGSPASSSTATNDHVLDIQLWSRARDNYLAGTEKTKKITHAWINPAFK